MDLQKVLAYQQVDGIYFRVEKKLRESAEAKNMAAWQKANKSASDELVKLNRKVEEFFQLFEKNTAKYLELKKGIDEALEFVAGVEDMTEIGYYQKNLEKQLAELEALEKDAAGINNELEDIKKSAENEQKKFNKSVLEFKASKQAFIALKESLQSEAADCLRQLKELGKEIAPEVMAKYKVVREERKKFPVLVPLNGTNCGGCGMEVSSSTCEKLNGGAGLAECQNCGRIIYKEN